MVFYKTTVKCDFGLSCIGFACINVRCVHIVSGAADTAGIFPACCSGVVSVKESSCFLRKVKYLGYNSSFHSLTLISQPCVSHGVAI